MSQRRVVAVALALAGLAWGSGAGATDEGALRRGEQVYARCLGCHAVESNRTGPQHCGLFGRAAGTAPGYPTYSQAMRNAKIVWDARTLDMFLNDPLQTVPGTTMGYAGVKDPKERGDLILWLRQATQPGKSCKLEK